MERLRDRALPVGLAMGVVFAIVGFTSGNYGLVGLGVVVGLVGYYSKRRDD
jgi:hypothetical protein